MGKFTRGIISFVKTAFFFLLACCLPPYLVISYFCVRIFRYIWIRLLSLLYPAFEFSKSRKVRTLVDTNRNYGVFHFLLQVNGRCDFNEIKNEFKTNVIEKRNKIGNLLFPKLRQRLISCWGQYAWVRDDNEFNINNNVILSPLSYRGRPVSDNNIQEFVSELIAKYLPPEVPPWQFMVIPTTLGASLSEPEASSSDFVPNESYYILVRVHHLVLADEKELQIKDLLMLNANKSPFQISTEDPKLMDFINKPKHIPNLWTHIMMTISNRWNEFIYRYDPLESPDVDKKQQIGCISQLFSILCITIVTVINDFFKGYQKTANQLQYKIRFLVNLFKREAYKRNLTTEAVIDSLLFSLNPFNIARNAIRLFWWFGITITLLSPYYMYRELKALKDIIIVGHCCCSNTLVGFISIYTPLIFCASREFLHIMEEFIKAPRNIYEELFETRSKEENVLQVKSYCGRKIVAFSNPVQMDEIRNRITAENIGETEYIFACLAGSLYEYFETFKNHSIPSAINITSLTLTKNYFLEKYNKSSHISGVVCLQLPLQKPNKNQMEKIHKTIERVQQKQIAIYLLSLAQTQLDIITTILPDFWLKILINYLSINFPVTVTEIFGDSEKFQTLWGHTVQDLLFFRPPQSKTCLSLNIHRFGDQTRLAVMADSQLAPDHNKLSNVWETNMNSVKF